MCVAAPSHNQFKNKPNLFLQSVTSPELTIEYLDPSIQLQYLFQINIHHTYLTLIIKLKYTCNLGYIIWLYKWKQFFCYKKDKKTCLGEITQKRLDDSLLMTTYWKYYNLVMLIQIMQFKIFPKRMTKTNWRNQIYFIHPPTHLPIHNRMFTKIS